MTGSEIAPRALPNELAPDQLRLRPRRGRRRLGRRPSGPAGATCRSRSTRLGERRHPLPAAPGQETCVVVLSGRDVTLRDRRRRDAGRCRAREGVFADRPSALWLPDGRPLEVSIGRAPEAGTAVVVVARAPRTDRDGVRPSPSRSSRATSSWRPAAPATRPARSTTSSRPTFPADRLELVEVVHARRATGRAGRRTSTTSTRCRARPCSRRSTTTGSGGPRRGRSSASTGPDRSRDAFFEVRDGDVVLVPDGYHPFAAAHGDDAYYLNALAGDRRTMACSFDPGPRLGPRDLGLAAGRSAGAARAARRGARRGLNPPARAARSGPRGSARPPGRPSRAAAAAPRGPPPDVAASSGAGRISEAMLAQLRDLDPGLDRDRVRRGRGQVVPGGDGLVVTGPAAAAAGPARSRSAPRSRASRGGPRPRVTSSAPAGSAADVRRPVRVPPRPAADRRRRSAPSGTASVGRSSAGGADAGAGRLGREGGVEAVERLAEPAGSRANARARPARSPRGAVGRATGSRVVGRRYGRAAAPSERTSSSLWRTTVDERLGRAAAQERRDSAPGSPSPRRRRARCRPSSSASAVRSRASAIRCRNTPADDRQQVEVAGVGRRGAPGQPVAGDEQRPVEAAAVVGHEPGVGRDGRGERGRAAPARRRGRAAAAGPGGTGRPPTSRARSRNATVPAAVASPVVSVSRQTSGTSGGGWPGSVASRSRSSGRIDASAGSHRTTSPAGVADDLAVDRRREPLGRARSTPRPTPPSRAVAAALGRMPRAPPGSSPSRRSRRRGRSSRRPASPPVVGRNAGPRRRARPSSRSASARASTSGSRRGPVQAGQPLSQPQPRSARPRRRPARRGGPTAARDSPTPPGTASYR